jgi:hypothetical protein
LKIRRKNFGINYLLKIVSLKEIKAMDFNKRVKVRIRHLIRSFHRWWNLGVCMFAESLAETSPMPSASKIPVKTNPHAHYNTGRKNFAQGCAGCGDVPTGRVFHRPDVRLGKTKFQSSARLKRGNERGSLPGEKGRKSPGKNYQ